MAAARRHHSSADLLIADLEERVWHNDRPRRRRSLRVRLLACLWSSWLDSALMAGVDPSVSPALERRVDVILSPRNRTKLVRSLRQRRESTGQRIAGDLRAQVDQTEVQLALGLLMELEDVLLSPEPVYCHGVVMAARIVGDGTGPLYAPRRRAELGERVAKVLASLRGTF